MTLNYPGPWQLRMFYTTEPPDFSPMQHVLNLNIDCEGVPDPDDDWDDIMVHRRAGADVSLETVSNTVRTKLRALLSAADATVDFAELWHITPYTFIGQYYSSLQIGLAGTGAGDSYPGGQIIYSFRSREGGIMKVVLMECAAVPTLPVLYADLDADNIAWVDLFTDDGASYFLARDTSYPNVFLRALPGSNEHLFKKRYRS